MARKKTNNKVRAVLNSAAFPFVLAVVFFFVICMNTASEIKTTALVLMILALAAMIVRFAVIRERIAMPIIVLGLFVLMCFVSTFYAPAGKFALQEFLKIASSFSLAILLICLAPTHGDSHLRWGATVLEGAAAIAALVSVDLISTRIISGAVISVLGLFTADFNLVSGIEAGTRITSLFDIPNVFAGCAGIGVLLSLGLIQSDAGGKTRIAHVCCLFITSFAFVLAFSMGATASIAVAFVIYLILEKRERRGALLVIMVETLAIAVIGAAIVSQTSFDKWDGFDIVPMAYLVVGCALLCVADKYLNSRISEKLSANKKTVPAIICVVFAAVIAFALAACLVTGAAELGEGETLRRAAYPDAGEYTLDADYTGDVTVTVESQNKQETMMHTSTVLYRGDLADAQFAVPEDSLVVYFNFRAASDAVINNASVGNEKIPLGYKLLPGFVANRLQGLFANENAIQRTVFFDDGMKIWKRGPVFGEGLGAFENGIKGVQSFFYQTKYAHNHYIQTLVETGIVGLILFVGLFAVSAIAVLRSRKKENVSAFMPALGALLVFMAIHAFTEVVFSVYCYLPLAYGVFALVNLACNDVFKWPHSDKKRGNKERLGVIAGFSAILVVFGVLLSCNITAKRTIERHATMDNLQAAARIDRYEWADHALSYVVSSQNLDITTSMRIQAEEYAALLAEVDSNFIPPYLAEYYFNNGREALAIDMLKKYVSYVAADPATWEKAFSILATYESDTDIFRAGVLEIAQMLEAWKAENIGTITLSDSTKEFIARISQ